MLRSFLALALSASAAYGVSNSDSVLASQARALHTEILDARIGMNATRARAAFRDRVRLLKSLVASGNDADLRLAFNLSSGLGPTLRSWATTAIGPDDATKLLEQRKINARVKVIKCLTSSWVPSSVYHRRRHSWHHFFRYRHPRCFREPSNEPGIPARRRDAHRSAVHVGEAL
jgi:hypothetical protein